MDDRDAPCVPMAKRCRRVALLAALFVCAVLVRLPAALTEPQPDDAYITYRYAARLGTGHGFTFNDGDRTLGTTSPLLAVLLSLPAAASCDLPVAAQGLSMVAGAVCCVVACDLLWLVSGSALVGLLTAGLLLFSPVQRTVAISGMEPALLCALMLGSLRLVIAERWTLAGLLAGLAAVTRPEGVLWLVALVPLLAAGDRWRRVPMLAALGPPLAWGAFALVYFGSPVPQSVAAKVAQGTTGAAEVLVLLLRALGRPLPVAALLLVGTALAVWRDRRLVPPAVFALLFLGAYAVARPAVYLWYPAPLSVAVAVLAGLVLAEAQHAFRGLDAARVHVIRHGGALLLILLVTVALAPALLTCRLTPERRPEREPHLATAGWLRTQLPPGSRVLVGDIGYAAYYNPDKTFYDYYGLVWRIPGALLRRPGYDFGETSWLPPLLRTLRPDVAILDMPVAAAPALPGYEAVPMPADTTRVAYRRHHAGPAPPRP